MTKQIIAALALAFGSTVAFAADPAADKPKAPATEAMDKKAGGTGQEAVDRGETPKPTAAKETEKKGQSAGKEADKSKEQTAGKEADQGAAGKPGSDKGRDWNAIDKDNNHLVSAEEMEAWLKANPGPAAGSAGKEGKASKEPAAKEPAADKEKKQ
ncbi:MAG: hypothetical protein ACREV2_14785 [Burkholderiales bacterium]